MSTSPRARSSRQPGITDVARVAGVSHQTVSRVLNDHPSVRDQTRMRVMGAISQLGYRRNTAARTLVTGRSELVGVVALATILVGPVSALSAVEETAGEAGFVLSIAQVHDPNPQAVSKAVDRLLGQSVAGLILLVPVEAAQEALDHIPADVPYVVIDGDLDRSDALATVDQEAGGALATRHLLAAGHETVWHVRGPLEWFDTRGRIAGWRRELEAVGAEVPPPLDGDWTAASGYRAGQLLARMPEVTAVFVGNDHMSLGLIRALFEHGRRVPEDVSVVGFDDVPEAGFFIPRLTTVRPDFDTVARQAWAMLLQQIDQDEPVRERRTVQPTLVERDSVAPPREGAPRVAR